MWECAIWRRLDTPGHDAAFLTGDGAGRVLRGMAVFRHEDGPACVDYRLDLAPTWETRRARLQGSLAGRPIDHLIERRPDGWTLDGVQVAGLDHLLDLDLGFTPATNLQHLCRVAPAQGEVVDINVAWFDLGEPTLTEMPQRYERLGETTYSYIGHDYQATLEMAANGFVKDYPGLWRMEA